MKLSIQLYTLRDLTSRDFAAVAKELAEIGLPAVELAGYGNLKSADAVKKVLDQNGLIASASHMSLEAMLKDPDQALQELQTLDCKNAVIPWVGESYRSAEGYRRLAGELTQIGQACAKKGVVLAYHNHNFEFQSYNGTTGLDIIWQHTDSKIVKAQLDTFWAAHAGVDPAGYITQLGSRVASLHLKDMAAGPEKKFAPVGSGIMDFKSIVAAAKKVGVQWGAIESDDCYGDPPMQWVRSSFKYLKSLGL